MTTAGSTCRLRTHGFQIWQQAGRVACCGATGRSARRSGRCGLDLAGRRPGAAAVRRPRRPLHRRPAPRNRHRRSFRDGRAGARERRRLFRGAGSPAGPLPDDSHCGRVLGHARPPRLDRSSASDDARRRGGRGHDRPERRPRRARTVRPPRHPADRRPERVPRSAHAASRASGGARAAAGEPASASDRASSLGACAAGFEAGAARCPVAAHSNGRAELGATRPIGLDPECVASAPSCRGSASEGSAPRRFAENGSPRADLARRCDSARKPRRRATAGAAHGTCEAADERPSPAAGGSEDNSAGPPTRRRVASRRRLRGSARGFHPRFQAPVPAHGGAEGCPYH